MKTPCEIVVTKVLPVLRKELAKTLVEAGMSQREIAKKLGLTEAAVSQYLKKKRGRENIRIKKIVRKKCRELLKENRELNIKDICELCVAMKVSGMLCKLHKKYEKDLVRCNMCFGDKK